MVILSSNSLVIVSWLLGMLAIASVAVLVGGRMAEQTRRVGLLKAVGGTPGLVAAVILAEYAVMALIAAAAGLLIGWLAAPLLTSPGAGLLGTAASPGLTVSTIAVVAIVALLVAMLATFIPAVRAARISTIRALAAAVRPPHRRAWLTALSARLPVPMLLGLRIAARRPRRTALSAAASPSRPAASSPCFAIATLAVSQFGTPRERPSRTGRRGLHSPTAREDQVLLVVTTMLATLAAMNVIFITRASVQDARQSPR